MRICLITPGHLSTNPRVVKEADALSEAGHDVTVVAASYLPWAREADRAFSARPWRSARPITFGPHARRGRRLVQAALNLSARGLFRLGVRSPPVMRMATHVASAELAFVAGGVEADLYIAHYVAALPAAALAAKRHGAAYAFDAEDFHSGEFRPDRAHILDRRLIMAIEHLYLPGAAYVTAASPGIAEAYASAYPISLPAVVLNVFPKAQAPEGPTSAGSSPDAPSVYWFSQTIGRNRGLETAVRAIGLAACRPHLFLRGVLRPDYRDILMALADQKGVSDRLHFLPPAPPDDMIRLAAEFDIGLVGETGYTQNRRIALTNKQFTYLLAGMPALMSDVEAHRNIAAQASSACFLYRAEDPVSLATAMDALLLDPATLAAARAAAFQRGDSKYNWEIEKRILLGCVDAALAAKRGVRETAGDLPGRSPSRQICLVTPGHLSTNPRLVKEADALAGAGYDVTVIAASYLPWARQADLEFTTRPWRIHAPIRFGPHAPRLTRLAQLARNRLARWLFRRGVGGDAVLHAACHQAGPDLLRAAMHVPADLYIAHNSAALPAAAAAAAHWGVPYAYDAEDFLLGEIGPAPRTDPNLRLIQATEARYLPGSAYVTAESLGIAEAIVETYSVPRPARVLNVFPRALAPAGPSPRGDCPDRPSVYWFSQTIGPDRGLESAVRAIALATTRPHLFLRGLPAKGYVERIEALADEVGVRDRLHLMGPASPGEMGRLAAIYDVGLSAEPGHDANNRFSLGNKLFTYLVAGLPIVASDVPAHNRFAPELEGAIRLFTVDDPRSLADALDAFLVSADGLAHARTTAFRLGQERFNWDVEQKALLACVETALSKP